MPPAHERSAEQPQGHDEADTDPDLLDALPNLRLDLARAPEHLLRRLFELTQHTVTARP